MLRRLPPLNALKVFEAAARHDGFTRDRFRHVLSQTHESDCKEPG
jgi:hypothetical protein